MQERGPDMLMNGLISSSMSVSTWLSPAQQWLPTGGTRAVRHTQEHPSPHPLTDTDTRSDATQ